MGPGPRSLCLSGADIRAFDNAIPHLFRRWNDRGDDQPGDVGAGSRGRRIRHRSRHPQLDHPRSLRPFGGSFGLPCRIRPLGVEVLVRETA